MCDLRAVTDRSLVELAAAIEGKREVVTGGVRVTWGS
jgi:hypothetical protein